MNIRSALESVPNVEFRFDEPLARHTTFKVGGPVAARAPTKRSGALRSFGASTGAWAPIPGPRRREQRARSGRTH